MLSNVQTIVLWLLALVFIVAGVAHFTFLRRDFARIVPPILPYKDAIVLITGALEILGGVGLLIPQTTRWAGIALIIYLIAIFPANVYGARHRIPIRGYPHPSVTARLPFQILLIVLLWWVTLSSAQPVFAGSELYSNLHVLTYRFDSSSGFW